MGGSKENPIFHLSPEDDDRKNALVQGREHPPTKKRERNPQVEKRKFVEIRRERDAFFGRDKKKKKKKGQGESLE